MKQLLSVLLAMALLVVPTVAALAPGLDPVKTVEKTLGDVLPWDPADVLPDDVEDTVEDTTDTVEDVLDDVTDTIKNVPDPYTVGYPVAVAQVLVDDKAGYLCPTAKEGWESDGSRDTEWTDCSADGYAIDDHLGATYNTHDVAVEDGEVTMRVTLVDMGPEHVLRTATIHLYRDGAQMDHAEVVFEPGVSIWRISKWNAECECYTEQPPLIDFYKDWKHVEFTVAPGHTYHVEVSATVVGQDLPLEDVTRTANDASEPFRIEWADGHAPSSASPAAVPSMFGMNLAVLAAIGLLGLVAAAAIVLRRHW